MRRGATTASGIGAPMLSVPQATVVDPIVRDCRGLHTRWRVVGFSYEKREITERCVACGETQERNFERREAS